MTDHEEEGCQCVITENANNTCSSLIPAGRGKSLGNEDIQLVYEWIRRGLISMILVDEPVMNIMNVKVIH